MGAAVEAAEVIEGKRLAIDLESGFKISRQATRRKIPRRDVVASRLDDRDAVEEHRSEIDPLLIGEQAAFHLRPTQAVDPVRPPVCEATPLLRIAHPDKPQVEDAML